MVEKALNIRRAKNMNVEKNTNAVIISLDYSRVEVAADARHRV